jgi:thioredoxin-related protein
MRYFFVIALVLISSVSLAQDNTSQLNWLTNVDQAEAISQQENKPILIYFTGSDWCSPCVALKKDFFETQEFAERAKNLVLVKIDYPRRMDIITPEQRAYNKTIISKYNTNKSFPNLVMINSRGAELGNISGYSSYNTYQDTSHHFRFVDEHLAKNN